MARVVYSLSVSVDGFIETPERGLDWVLIDEELHCYFNDEARDEAAFLYGRRMYELTAGYWPTADQDPSIPPFMAEWAAIWRETPKVVFSRTLGELSISGAGLASAAMRLGLIDEYRILVQPVILGAGTRFFPPLDARIGLRLAETRTFGSGVVLLQYLATSV